MKDRLELLIDILHDPKARLDERHDAAMCLEELSDDRLLPVVLDIVKNPNEDDLVLDACGIALAKYLYKSNKFTKDDINEILQKLPYIAQKTAYERIKDYDPDWFM